MKASVTMKQIRRAGRNQIQNSRKGFTLVELIVVLVILAILAAILIPALMGYIDKAKEKQGLIEAEAIVTAVQTELTELYAKEGGSKKLGEPIIPEKKKVENNDNGDINSTSTTFASKVFSLVGIDSEPYCLVVGVGSNAKGTDEKTTLHDKYRVYFLFYMKTADSKPWFYFNGEWTHTYPRAGKSDKLMSSSNVVQDGLLKGKRLQMYCLGNAAWRDHGSYGYTPFWDWVRTYKE